MYKELAWDKKMIAAAAVLAAIPMLLSFLRQPEPSAENLASKASGESLQTRIPRGFVLIPIEAQNYEALDSILGRYGIVDLYAGQRLIARNVRILRAPQNPSQFAVLVQEGEAGGILAFSGAFTVTVKRQEAGGTEFVKPTDKVRHKIVYEGG